MHVSVFLLATIPAGEAGTHEKIPVKGIRDDIVELLLPLMGVGGKIGHGSLPVFQQLEAGVGITGQQLNQEKAKGGLPNRFHLPADLRIYR